MFDTERLCLGCMNDNGGERVCPICGYDSETPNPENSLPVKFVLNNRFLLGKVISLNGEGITYIGWDNEQNTIVEVKEYFPISFAHRNPDLTVSIIEGGEYTYNEGLLEFLEINRKIKKAELSALVPVLDVFEENGTVYAVYQHILGIKLGEFIEKNGGILKWEQARALFLPLIDTLSGMNEIGIIHGGISVDTIIVGRDGKMRISDYSIKKLRLADSELKEDIIDGYAAPEQYGTEGMHIDKYTDVYGLCATIFRVIIGAVPPVATQRLQNDAMSIPAKFAEELPRHVLAALANGLQVMPSDRTKNIEILKNELVYGEISGMPTKKAKPEKTKTEVEPKKKGASAKYVLISSLCTAAIFLVLALVLVLGPLKEDIFGGESSGISSDETSVNAPVIDQIGDIESGAEITAKLYDVPDLKGKYYADIIDNDDYEMFEFVITDKAFSDTHPKGTVCAQSIEAGGAGVPRDTKIELTISIGPKEVKIPNLKGLSEMEAKLELLKQGFLYDNIEVIEKYDDDEESAVVLEQEPKFGEQVSTDIAVKIYINSYKPEESSKNSSNSN
ncbi:MAG: PASTA domain-containing protein [Clostridia bacterium]|nr:PASTA domain-containing protein [Clostridia bacterium]